MRITLVGLLLAPVLALANPVFESFINEFATGPDHPWVELHRFPEEGPYELTNWLLVTTTSCCTLSCTLDDSEYIVIDSAALALGIVGSGTFRLNPECDTITLYAFTEPWDSVYYPRVECGWSASPVPPPGGSASHHYWYYSMNWYIDSTPTPGAANDDDSRISGVVRGEHGEIPERMSASASGPNGRSSTDVWHDTSYCIGGLGPGRYGIEVYVEFPDAHLDTVLPESIDIGYDTTLSGIDVIVPLTGVAETRPARLSASTISQQGHNLIVTGNGRADITLFDLSGREVTALYNGVLTGEQRIALPRLAPGIYFARATVAGNRITTKVVIR